MSGKYRLTTLGCKVNQYESEQLRAVLESFGLRPAAAGETADVAVVNTCAVTAEAMRKNRQAVRGASRDGTPEVIVVGCGATADPEGLRRLPGVTAVTGHDADAIAKLRSVLARRFTAGSDDPSTAALLHRTLARNDESIISDEGASPTQSAGNAPTHRSARTILPDLPLVKSDGELTEKIEAFAGHQRAFLKIQDGCDAFCTYCIIPNLRPTLRSKPVSVAVEETRRLVAAGHREIVLTGIFLGAYGRETAIRKRFRRASSPLAELVEALAAVEGLLRLRLSSLEPGDVDNALLAVLARHENCVPHLHLPLQSGSGAILRRMNRQYGPEDFTAMIERVRAALERPAITTDVIVGFPGESEADFAASLDAARFAAFCKIHAFPFSPRPGTAAARWQKDFVPREVVRERMRRLAELEQELSLAFRQPFVGRAERVIVERDGRTSPGTRGPANVRHGRCDRYFDVHFDGSADTRAGDVVEVRIDRVTPTRTHGTCLSSKADKRLEAV